MSKTGINNTIHKNCTIRPLANAHFLAPPVHGINNTIHKNCTIPYPDSAPAVIPGISPKYMES
jgi:hypothetical protein